MCVGFLCHDGVVIGADRQVTNQNYTFPECKLITVCWKNGSGILGYSGERDAFSNFCSELVTRVAEDAVFSRADLKRLLKDCLKATLRKKEIFLTLFGFCLDREFPTMLVSNSAKRVVDAMDCEIIGYSDSPLSRSLLGRLRQATQIKLSVHQARIYAVDFVSQAKKYDGQYVGGGIDVVSVDRGSRSITVCDPTYTKVWEDEIAAMHNWQDILFNRIADKQYPVSMDQFMERLRAFRKCTAPEEDERWVPHLRKL
jgi:hypothetical protein